MTMTQDTPTTEPRKRPKYSWEERDPSERSNPLRDDKPINDPAEAERVLRASLKAKGLPAGITILSSRERGLIPKDVLRKMLEETPRTDLDPDEVIRRFINDPENHFTIFTIAEHAEKIGVTGSQLRKFMQTYGWRFKKAEGRKWEIRPDERK